MSHKDLHVSARLACLTKRQRDLQTCLRLPTLLLLEYYSGLEAAGWKETCAIASRDTVISNLTVDNLYAFRI